MTDAILMAILRLLIALARNFARNRVAVELLKEADRAERVANRLAACQECDGDPKLRPSRCKGAGVIGLALLLLLPSIAAAQIVAPNDHPTFAWNQNAESDIAGYRFILDNTISDVGNVTTFTAPALPPGDHIAAVTAYNTAGKVSGPSTPPFAFTIAAQTPPACAGHPLTIAVEDWTRTVAVGARGRILFTLTNPFPVVLVQVRSGTQLLGQFDGADLRDVPGSKFSVPRTPGTYPISVLIKDNAGCSAETTLARSFDVS